MATCASVYHIHSSHADVTLKVRMYLEPQGVHLGNVWAMQVPQSYRQLRCLAARPVTRITACTLWRGVCGHLDDWRGGPPLAGVQSSMVQHPMGIHLLGIPRLSILKTEQCVASSSISLRQSQVQTVRRNLLQYLAGSRAC